MKIPLEPEYRKKFYSYLDEIFDSNFWTEGPITKRFEKAFGSYISIPAKTSASGGTALLAILEYLKVRDHEVIVPANTFWATVQAVKKAGAKVVYADCNKEDLCLSLEDLKKKVSPKTSAVILVHIGGHIAFQSEEISRFCRQQAIPLVEDCAHVHGGFWNGKTGGHYGFAGAYSFYATKTMPLGEGGMVVSRDTEFLDWYEKYRNYGKETVAGKITYPLKEGFNCRMSEWSAALGLVQLERLPKILQWKRALAAKYDQIFENRVRFPEGMNSGYYKYIVFGYPPLKQRTGMVFAETDLGPTIEGLKLSLPHTDWVVKNHQCPPMYYGWESAELSPDELIKILF